MDETVTYLSFPYSLLTHYSPSGPAGQLFYEGLLDRYRENIELTTCSNEDLEPCWDWTGNTGFKLYHRWEGMVLIKRLAFALYMPDDYNTLAKSSHRRMRLTTHRRCSNEWCVRPDHMIAQESQTYRGWLFKPQKRGRRERSNDELKYKEIQYLRGYMYVGIGNPSEQLVRLSERLKIPYPSLVAGWLNIKRVEEMKFSTISIARAK